MNYESMTDRELSLVVAERVFALEVCRDVDCKGCNKIVPEAEAGSAAVKPYATEIACAFEVVEAMREGGFIVRITDEVRGGWCVKFNGYHDINELLPRAIVIAALRALDA